MEIKENTTSYSFHSYTFIPSEKILLRGDERVSLRPKTAALLKILVENAGNLCEKEKLIDEIWDDVIIEEGNLNRTVSELRKILGDVSGEAKYIQTVTRVGYRFIADVSITIPKPKKELQIENAELSKNAKDELVEQSKSSFLNWKVVGFTVVSLLVFLGIGATIWKFQNSKNTKLTKFGEFQVTDSKNNEDSAFWTTDGKIRFASHSKENPWVLMRINADGSELAEEGNKTSPDGKKIITYDETDKKLSYISNVDGSNKRKLPFTAGNMDWSNVSNEIVVQFFPDGKREGSDIAIVNLENLAMTNLTNTPNMFEGDPSFSSDAQQILFTNSKDGNAEIYSINRDGSNMQRLTNNPAWESFATFSPDGTQISYNSDRDKEKNNVYLMNLDGSGKETSLPRDDYGNYVGTGSWSPDGTKLVYSSDRNGIENIFTIDAELNKPQPFFADKNGSISFFAISPDGNFFVYLIAIAQDKFEICLLNKTTNQTKILREINNESHLSFSPDNKTIAFQERIEGNTDICLINMNGSDFRNISNNPASDVSAKFSPDGSKMLFLSNRDSNGIFDVYTMNVDGTNQKKIYSDTGTNTSAVWSNDSKEIYFSNDKEDGRNGNFEIFKVSADGKGEVTRHTTRPQSSDEKPTISPDGKKIAFQSLQKGNTEIYVMNNDGTGLLRLTRNLAEDRNPVWSADGKKLYFSSNRTEKFEIFELNVN